VVSRTRGLTLGSSCVGSSVSSPGSAAAPPAAPHAPPSRAPAARRCRSAPAAASACPHREDAGRLHGVLPRTPAPPRRQRALEPDAPTGLPSHERGQTLELIALIPVQNFELAPRVSHPLNRSRARAHPRPKGAAGRPAPRRFLGRETGHLPSRQLSGSGTDERSARWRSIRRHQDERPWSAGGRPVFGPPSRCAPGRDAASQGGARRALADQPDDAGCRCTRRPVRRPSRARPPRPTAPAAGSPERSEASDASAGLGRPLEPQRTPVGPHAWARGLRSCGDHATREASRSDCRSPVSPWVNVARCTPRDVTSKEGS
jgi:hypothetical protein